MPNIGPLIIFYIHPELGTDKYVNIRTSSQTIEELVERWVPEGVEHTVITEPRPSSFPSKWRNGAWVLDKVIARSRARRTLVLKMDLIGRPFTINRIPEELVTWGFELTGADVVVAGGNSALISAKATALGVTAIVAATAITTESAQYLRVVGALSGELEIAEAALALVDTQVEIDKVLADSIAKMVTEVEALTT